MKRQITLCRDCADKFKQAGYQLTFLQRADFCSKKVPCGQCKRKGWFDVYEVTK